MLHLQLLLRHRGGDPLDLGRAYVPVCSEAFRRLLGIRGVSGVPVVEFGEEFIHLLDWTGIRRVMRFIGRVDPILLSTGIVLALADWSFRNNTHHLAIFLGALVSIDLAQLLIGILKGLTRRNH